MQDALDFDIYTNHSNGTSPTNYIEDTPLSYKWTTEGNIGSFAVTDANGHTTSEKYAMGTTATWVAPDDISQATTVVIKCTIDDSLGARVSAPATGSRDDTALVRSVTVVVMAPTVEFKGNELVAGTLRACAGGVDDHAAVDPNPETHNDGQYRAHTRQIDLSVKLNGEPMPNAKFTLRFEGNRGHDYGDGRAKKTAKLHKTSEAFDASHPWQETLEVQADGAGKLSVWVLSSDVISTPRLQAILKPVAAPAKPVVLGEIGCDFAASVTFRNFDNPVDSNDPDDYGWIFDFPKLVDLKRPAGQARNTPAKVYLKFKIDPKQTEDRGNWQFVNGHELELRVVKVRTLDPDSGEAQETQGTAEELQSYAYFANSVGPASDKASVTRTTKSKGETSPQPYVIAGPSLQSSFTIYVRAKDKTEHKE